MFTTSLAAAVIAGLLVPGALSRDPNWAPDYAKALTLSAQSRKPVAVFVTNGDLKHLMKGDEFGLDTAKALRSNFIAVRVDTTTDIGKKQAEAFGLSEGVVISDRTGGVIALRHEGPLPAAELNGYLTQFSGQSTVVTTEYRSSVTVQPQPVVQPATYTQPAFEYTQPRPILNAVQNFNTAVFGQPLIGGS